MAREATREMCCLILDRLVSLTNAKSWRKANENERKRKEVTRKTTIFDWNYASFEWAIFLFLFFFLLMVEICTEFVFKHLHIYSRPFEFYSRCSLFTYVWSIIMLKQGTIDENEGKEREREQRREEERKKEERKVRKHVKRIERKSASRRKRRE